MTAVILGGQPLNFNIVNRMRQFGMRVVVVDYRSDIQVNPDLHIISDAKDPHIGKVLKANGVDSVDLVYTSMDNAGLAQRDVCQEFGLCCPTVHSILAAHDKEVMHKKWLAAGLLNRFSVSFCSFNGDDLQCLSKKYDLIFKPTDSCASRGITVVGAGASVRDLEFAFSHAKENSDSGRVNVEEFVRGTEFTVELIGDKFGNVSAYSLSKKYHTVNTDNNKIAVKLHYNPSDVSDELYERIANYGRACYKAIGLSSSMGHLEVLLKDDGTISPVEIGARSSGYIASDLVDIASGKCFLKGLWDVQHGGKVSDAAIPRSEMSSMYYFYDIPAGATSRRKSSLLPFVRPFAKSLFHDRSSLDRGKQFGKLLADTDRVGYEILYGKRDEFSIDKLVKSEREFLHDFVEDDTPGTDCSVPIFDSIVHPTINGTWLNKRYDGLADISELSKDLDQYNIVGAFAVGMSGVGSYSEFEYAKFCQRDVRLKPIAFWDPRRDVSDMASLKSKGYVGIKIHPRLSDVKIDDPRIISAIHMANRLGLIVLCCSFSGITERFASATVDLKFILLHSGYCDFESVVQHMSKSHNKVLFDLSYTLYHCHSLRRRVKEFALVMPSRVCIGSDHPEINHKRLREFLSAEWNDVPKDILHLIYHRNIERFIEA